MPVVQPAGLRAAATMNAERLDPLDRRRPFADDPVSNRHSRARKQMDSARGNYLNQLLSTAEAGDARAADELVSNVYDELRRLAQKYFRRERAGHTLQPTAVVHEAYIRLIDQSRANYRDRTHFF